jgi:hypothetical protein
MQIASLFVNTGIVWVVLEYFQKSKGLNFQSKEKYFLWVFKLAPLFLVVTALVYFFTPSYFSYIETSIASGAAYWLKGHELYSTLMAQDRYSMQYGPWPSLSTAFFLVPGIFVIQFSKLTGIINLAATLILSIILVDRLGLTQKTKSIVLGVLCLSLLGFDNYSYVNRPDSFLIAYSLGALFFLQAFRNQRKFLFYIEVGILCGLCAASKIHGIIYFVPVAAFCFEKRKDFWSWPLFGLTLIIGAIVSFLPFLLPRVSLENFIAWLRSTSSHGFALNLFFDNLSYSAPYLLGLYFCGVLKDSKKTFLVLLISIIITSLVGSLKGAGTHHLLPFIPFIIYLGAMSYMTLEENKKSRAHIFLAALFVGLSYDSFISQKAILKYFLTIPEQVREFADLKALRSKYTGPVEIGYGDNSQLEMSYYKPYFVARGDSLLLDSDALVDMTASGMDLPESTFNVLRTCKIPYMILPRGDGAWMMWSGFGYRLFSDEWIKAFSEKYKPVESTNYYTIYKCR